MAATREQLHELLDLVLDINGMERRKRKLTGDKPTAFFNFSGHVAEVEVEVYNNGWDAEREYDYRKSVYIDRSNPEKIINKLREIRAKIEAESLADSGEAQSPINTH
jgi:hypothetical protein